MAKTILRPEARPFSWERLDRAQKDALKQILRMLEQAVRHAELRRPHARSASEAVLTSIDPSRENRVIFLHGDRGTGKTSVLLSLLQALADRNWECGNREVRDSLDRLRPHVVLLEPLDMEPLPCPSNLLAQVLVRIEKAAQCLVRGDGQTLPSDYSKGLLKLRQFATDIAMAWEGNLNQRAQHLDPEAYADEVLILEHARLSLAPRLADVLGELGKELSAADTHSYPMGFLLAVDDFDLNPARALELLRLLRMITVPQLIILIVGNVEVAEQIFALQISGDLAAIARQTSGDRLPFSEASVGGLARHIAAQALRKLVPPNQRVHLRHMSVDEAMRFRPDEDADILARLLQRIPVELDSVWTEEKNEISIPRVAGKDIVTFADFLRVHSEIFPGGQPYGQRSIYSGMGFLSGPTRHVVDLYMAFEKLVAGIQPKNVRHRNQWRLEEHEVVMELLKPENRPIKDRTLSGLLDVLATEAHRAVAEDSRLNTQERDSVIGALRKGAHGQWELIAGTLHPVWAAAKGFALDVPVYAPPEYEIGGKGGKAEASRGETGARRVLTHCRLVAQRYHRVAIKVDSGGEPGERVRHLLILIHDLMALGSGGIAGGSLVASPWNPGWARTEYDLGPGANINILWLWPPWRSFWEAELIAACWNHVLEVVRLVLKATKMPEEELASRLFYGWVKINTKILLGEAPFGYDSPFDALESRTSWSTLLADDLDRLYERWHQGGRERRSPWADLVRNWLPSVAALMAPETAFPKDVVIELYRKEPKWLTYVAEHYGAAVRNVRAEWLSRFVAAMSLGLVERLHALDHPINQMFGLTEDEKVQAIRMGTELRERLLREQLSESLRTRQQRAGDDVSL